jgi:hypothetical protein
MIPKEMVKLKHEVTDKNVLNKWLNAKLGGILENVWTTNQALGTADDEKVISKKEMESSMVV